jgi:hypothetical protein
MPHRRWLLSLFILILAGTTALAQDVGWEEAAARLRKERTMAETCAGLLKKYADAAAKDRGALAYADAKGDYDAIIAGLSVALARKRQPAGLPDLQNRLAQGFEKREAFCRNVQDALPPAESGHRGALAEIIKGALEPLTKAAVELYTDAQKSDELTRAQIRTQLEASSWPDFATVPPSP